MNPPEDDADLLAPLRPPRRVALVHDWLVVYGGAERVLEQMLRCFPGADLFTLVDAMPAADRGFMEGRKITTSFIQRLPFGRTRYRGYLPLMPLAIEQLDLSAYELVISSSYAVAKGVLTGPDQLHLCMCYSPIRYAWDLQHQYLEEARLTRGVRSALARLLLHYIRLWDYRTAAGVDQFIAISEFVRRRITRIYRRDAEVVYPPVDLARFELRREKEGFYLTASRMVPYKKVGLIVEAFSTMPDKRLVVIGDGPGFAAIKASAGPNVTLLGFQPHSVLEDHMRRARAFVFAAIEDFGIVPLEAQACGTPVIAFRGGAALETIRPLAGEHPPTGLFFEEQTVASLVAAVETFEACADEIDPDACRANAQRFSREAFQASFRRVVRREWERFLAGR